MQLSYNSEMPIAQIGQIADTRNRTIQSHPALSAIPFGRMVALSNNPDTPNAVRLPRRTLGVLVFSGDLVTSNVINGSVNGQAIDAVTFATDHDTTIAAIAAAIEELDGVKRAVVDEEDTDLRTIKIEVIDADIVLASWAVTLGAGQATIATVTAGGAERLIGVSTFTHTQENPGAGGAQYAAGDTVNVMRQGSVWVPCVDVPSLDIPLSETPDFYRPVNVIIGGTDAGKFSGYPAPGGAVARGVESAEFIKVIEGEDDTASAQLLLNLPATQINA